MSDKQRPYNDREIAEQIKHLDRWSYEAGVIRRRFKTDGWAGSMMLANAIGYVAEAADHHPDLTVAWGSLSVALSTHSAGGITDKDFDLARRIEELVRGSRGGA